MSLMKNVPFNYDESLSQDNFVTIAEMSRLASSEFIKTKAKVASAENVIEIQKRHGQPLTKQKIKQYVIRLPRVQFCYLVNMLTVWMLVIAMN